MNKAEQLTTTRTGREETETGLLREEIRILESLIAGREKIPKLLATLLSAPSLDFRALFEGLPELYVVFLPDTPRFTITAVSDALLHATRTERDKLVGQPIFEVFPDKPNDPQTPGGANLRSCLDLVLRERISHALPLQRYDIQRPPSEGGGFEERYWSVRNTPTLGKNGEVAYIVHHAQDVTEHVRLQEREKHDITARKQVEEALHMHAQEIERLNARLQKSMIETHHRVKNNLQMVSALIDMQRAGGEKTVPMAELARLGAHVLALGVIHDILTQEAKAGSDQEMLSVKAVLERLVLVLEHTMGDRPLQFAFEEARLVCKQATMLALVTNELVSNALKHGSGETTIYFRVHSNTATLEVCDEGPGFPDGFDAETASNTGLELVENIVRLDLRGHIVYANRPEGGARITIIFPITTQQERV